MDDQEKQNRYDELAQKLLNGTITAAEKQEYLDWLNREEEALNIPADLASNRPALKNRIFETLQSSIQAQDLELTARSMEKGRRRNLFRYAAAAAIVFIVTGFVIYYFNINKKSTAPQPMVTKMQPVATDVLPGRDGAMLTLANGQQLLLDSLGNGVIAIQGKTNIKIQNGQLVYDVMQAGSEMLYNTMSTPKGRQYQMLLPDGSRVWMNAASSITYPVAFIGKERNVTITGEVYIEVAKNKEKPFIVNVDGKASVQALGTSFNINAYADEPGIKTTLLEGKVKIVKHERVNGKENSILLDPGQQAVDIAHAPLTIRHSPDLEEVMAWKNGRFEFIGNSIQSVMGQLSRWYDVDIVYEGALPEANFVGAIARTEKLSRVLQMLELTNVLRFKIEKKTATGEAAQIIVTRK
ncbi:FecR family protein [Longitalea arenae]|uniref:FecR family protein n=1 Tax=Longitalea arenae TaxID=2812558 RepID=UPI0019673D23|nr:FecR domain-containing protein [Longitalea arenae]